MSRTGPNTASTDDRWDAADDPTEPRTAAAAAALEPLGDLPRLSRRQLRLERWLSAWGMDGRLPPFLSWLETGRDGPEVLELERPEVLWYASGIKRPGLVAQFHVPRLATRLAVGIENALAHAIVDRLLGFDRSLAEGRLQLTPVEWGVWTVLFLRAVDALASALSEDRAATGHGPGFGPGAPLADALEGLALDRVGPDPFNTIDLGSIVTARWTVRAGAIAGSLRIWLPGPLAERWLDAPPLKRADDGRAGPPVAMATAMPRGPGSWSGHWRAVAGPIALPQGLGRLRVGGVLPLQETAVRGTPASPSGPIDLLLELDGQDGRFRIPIAPVPGSGGRLVRIEGRPLHEPSPRAPSWVDARASAHGPDKETSAMSQPQSEPATGPASSVSTPAPAPASVSAPAAPGPGPLDVPVTLTVELGRVNLTLDRLADLKPGDVVELGRHSRAPVELTSNGRLVARGELVLIDTDLGVRLTHVFL